MNIDIIIFEACKKKTKSPIVVDVNDECQTIRYVELVDMIKPDDQ